MEFTLWIPPFLSAIIPIKDSDSGNGHICVRKLTCNQNIGNWRVPIIEIERCIVEPQLPILISVNRARDIHTERVSPNYLS